MGPRLTVLNVAYPFAPVGPDAVGGAEQVLSHIDGGIVRAGHRSIVIAAEGSKVAGHLIAVPAVRGTIDDAARATAWQNHRAAIAMALRQWPIDLIHFHGIDVDRYLPAARVRCLITLHLPPSWYRDEALRPQRPSIWVHGVSQSQHRRCPPSAALLAPIPNGVAVDALSARHAKRGFALMLGRICPEKGVHRALEAARRADLSLLLGGRVFPYPDHARYFYDKVEPLLDRRRRFLGPLDFARKRRMMTAARCVVIPSEVEETSSLVAMEALACGTPVVAFARGALPEIIDDGRTGLLVRDVAELAAAMREAASLDPEECRVTARRRFAREVMVARYLARYAAIAQQPSLRLRWFHR
jgi:glycosyltransferase involved in cell wall biosynthesis